MNTKSSGNTLVGREELTVQKRVSSFNTRIKELEYGVFSLSLGWEKLLFEDMTRDKNDGTRSVPLANFLLNT